MHKVLLLNLGVCLLTTSLTTPHRCIKENITTRDGYRGHTYLYLNSWVHCIIKTVTSTLKALHSITLLPTPHTGL